ncbi:MAG: OmpA family protein [Gammaproteobacteria bacterium]
MTGRHGLIALGLVLASSLASAQEERPLGEAVERHLPLDSPFQEWVYDPDRLAEEAGDRLETREVLADRPETVKLTGVVPPIRFESGVADIPDSTVDELARILESMRHRQNVRLHLVGHADTQPLSPRLAAVYGDNAGLSRARAGQVAEHFQTALALPPESISFEWAGDTEPVASNETEAGRALNRRVEVEVWYDEMREAVVEQEVLVPHEIRRVKVCRMETLCKLRYVDGHAHRARLRNLIAPLTYTDESIDVSDRFVAQIRQSLANLADKENVVVKFVGHTDDAALSGPAERIYGTHLGLSKARARRVALAVQERLALPTAAVTSDGKGSAEPVADGSSARGRALNRRVEVEFWYDDPLQELPDEPQLCPESPGAELVTRVHEPSFGSIPPVEFVDGQAVMPGGFADDLGRAMQEVADKRNVRLRFVGYTRNERLERRTAMVYGDDIGLSAARARRVMETIAGELPDAGMEFEGRGYVHADDVVNSGFVQGETSYVAAQVVYDELAVLDDYEGVEITRLSRELTPKNPLGLNLMRITVDGEPIDDPERSSADIQRCTDVALDDADIRFGFDNLRSAPRLAVTASPSTVTIPEDLGDIFMPADIGSVRFRMYANYSHFIDRAEVRIFANGQSLESRPIAVVELDDVDGVAEWQPPREHFRAPMRKLAYVVRAYGTDGNFDETDPQPLWLVYGEPPEDPTAPDEAQDAALLAAFGENELATQNIQLASGTVDVRGSGIPAGHTVWVAGREVPVDDQGNFVAEEILPQGTHTVEVAVLDEQGNGELFLRDLELKKSDWFYVGMADLTLSQNDTSGPIDLMSGDEPLRDPTSSADGRLAFFVDGKFGDHWRLVASADTREEPLGDLFSNFMSKSPDSLLRRIDPDYYYPTFGDDSTVEELAPTMGKFYVRLSEDENHAMWGNFKIGYMQNELAQVDRGLYGANLRFQSDAATDFGERRFAADAFVAEPGTVASREEFRGTGGSLYYLRRQDILTGSERVRVEIRDKASGLVTGVVNLTPSLDYDIDYLQGRILLTEPLSATADDQLLVRSNAAGGNDVYLVVRYEYTPGFDELDALATGGQAHYWFGDYLRMGLTSSSSEQDEDDSSLHAADVTLRMSAATWLKLQGARSEGIVSTTLRSDDGGYEFYGQDPLAFANAEAGAWRADLSIDSDEVLNRGDARITLYMQELEAGYSAPGLNALTDTRHYGGTFSMPVFRDWEVSAKMDNRIQEQGLETRAMEYNLTYRLGERWDVSTGYRQDERIDAAGVPLLTQQIGERSDAVVEIGYSSRSDWSAYAFAQETLSTTGNREENGRVGVGGAYQVFDNLRVNGEISSGDLGPGGRVGTNYLHSDRTSLYLNYTLENERTDNGLRSYRGEEGNLVAGVKTRLSDSTSVFLEERYQHSTVMTGLTHSTGISLAPTERLNLGMHTDIGTLEDIDTGAETDRRAASIQIGYGFEKLQLSSGIEYRDDEVQQLDLGISERTTWLFRNSFRYQHSPGARVLGKFNHSTSDSSLGNFYDGGFTEAVLGYALRPVTHDRVNALVKYTYFYNVPTTDQVTLNNTAAEYIQKSHVAAVDVTYDLTPDISLGGKYAYRLGEISLDRVDRQFFDNSASLYVLRLDWQFREDWEAMAESRLLDMADLDQRRSGALVGVSRYFGDNVKIGVGYSFADFSDDLTDLDYDHQGFFLNLTGAM